MGTAHYKKGNYPQAISLLRHSIGLGSSYQQLENWLAYFTFSEYYFQKGEIDSSIYYAQNLYDITKQINLPEEMHKAIVMLAKAYQKKGIKDSALKYFTVSLALNDSINNTDKIRKLQSQDFEEQIHRREIEDEKNKLKTYFLIGGLVALLIIAGILYNNNISRRKTNTVLLEKNKKIEATLSELKSTQAQLIQSEKMASLGELTAGIAHEIQNPLNFVNNFSEVNKDLLIEMKDEIDKGNIGEVKLIANDVIENEEKISHHGKRADAIVKGMLQHSRSSTNKKEPTDINKLADEYLRLSYHGLRAKDQSFNVTMQTDYDSDLSSVEGKINIISQDIGRVLLNLFNNAFYAVTEKKKQAADNYEPTVSVSTKKADNKVLISVKDNGNGIPQKIADKIFQPFFTTKPTGQGTGLGLSLSYDIIKAHGGEIKVNTRPGEGTEFIIQLPA
jgi:signal transduction histidine kinase